MMGKDNDEILYQLHLSGFGHSDRGVRVRQLDIDVIHECEIDAAKSLGKDATSIEFRRTVVDSWVARMVAEVTEEQVKEPRTIKDEDVQWRKVTLQDMRMHRSDIFTAKDISALERMCAALHEVTSEIDDLMGKAVRVTT